MASDFPRILTLLRKEQGYSQKFVAAELGVSQALLSHYEKGIRECGLAFLIRCADFFEVSCDYLLGRTPERTGTIITADDIPEGDNSQRGIGGGVPVLSKKLLSNSLSIVFDLIATTQNKTLINEVSGYLFLSVYTVFRAIYNANPKNPDSLFSFPASMSRELSAGAMHTSLAKISGTLSGTKFEGIEPIKNTSELIITSEKLTKNFPQMAPSLLNLLKNAEGKIPR